MRALGLALALGIALTPAFAAAHPLSFGVLHVTERADRVALSFRYSGTEGSPRAATPRLPDRCRYLSPPRPEPIEGGVSLRAWLRCEGGVRGAAFGAPRACAELARLAPPALPPRRPLPLFAPALPSCSPGTVSWTRPVGKCVVHCRKTPAARRAPRRAARPPPPRASSPPPTSPSGDLHDEDLPLQRQQQR